MNRRTFLLALASAGLRPGRALAAVLPARRPRLALIIDDIGFSRKRARAFLKFNIPITYAVLPRVLYTDRLAKEIHACGHEVILHQPMEPIRAGVDPGPGALYVKDSGEHIERILDDNLSTVPHAVGINNHMGSRFTQEKDKVVRVMDVARRRGLYFVDSLTTSRSRAYLVARHMHLATLKRHFFLDMRPDPDAVCLQLCRALYFAHRHGHAVVIGHPHPETIQGLRSFLATAARPGQLDWVYVSQLLG